MRQGFVLNVAVVGAVEQNQCPVFVRIVHELLQGFAAEHCSGRVVRAAKVNQLHRFLGQIRLEIVFGSRSKVGYLRKMSVTLQHASTASHHVGVQIDRVNRVQNCDLYIFCKKFLDVRHIALGTIAHEDVIRVHFDTTGGVFATHDCLPQKVVTLLRAVTAERSLFGHFVHGLVHGLDNFRNQGRGHVANAKADNVCIRFLRLIFLDFLGDRREKVAARQQVVVRIYNGFVHS